MINGASIGVTCPSSFAIRGAWYKQKAKVVEYGRLHIILNANNTDAATGLQNNAKTVCVSNTMSSMLTYSYSSHLACCFRIARSSFRTTIQYERHVNGVERTYRFLPFVVQRTDGPIRRNKKVLPRLRDRSSSRREVIIYCRRQNSTMDDGNSSIHCCNAKGNITKVQPNGFRILYY